MPPVPSRVATGRLASVLTGELGMTEHTAREILTGCTQHVTAPGKRSAACTTGCGKAAAGEHVTVAKLRMPQQDISGDENLEKLDHSPSIRGGSRRNTRPSPTSCGQEKRSTAISILRHKLNNQERKEPRSADDVLPCRRHLNAAERRVRF